MEGDCVGLTRLQTDKPGFVPGFSFAMISDQLSRVRDSRSAFPITLTEDSAIAAAPIIGASNNPTAGYSTPVENVIIAAV